MLLSLEPTVEPPFDQFQGFFWIEDIQAERGRKTRKDRPASGDQDVSLHEVREKGTQSLRILHVVKNEEVPVVGSKPGSKSCAYFLRLRVVTNKPQALRNLGGRDGQGFRGFGLEPQDIGMVVGMPMAILDGGLRLPYPTQAADGLGEGYRVPTGEPLAEVLEDGFPATEVGVATGG